MDKKLQDLVDMMLMERFGLAELTMMEESCVDAEQIATLIELSEQIDHHPGISGDAMEVVQKFIIQDSDNNARLQKYLYMQGAKDCVAILRELGVIK